MRIVAENTSFYIFVNTQCSRRSIEASKLSRYFIENGLYPAANPEKADLIVVFTCGGFKFAEDFSLLTIEKSLKFKPSKVIITGCLTRIDRESLKHYDALFIVPPEDLGMLDGLIQARVPYSESAHVCCVISNVHDHYRVFPVGKIKYFIDRIKYFGLNSENLKTSAEEVGRILRHGSRNSVFAPRVYLLEIAKGCLGNCSYCAMRLAAGRFHSFPDEQIIREFKKGLEEKYENFALVAGDIGCYGVDIGTNLPNLLKKLFAVEGDYKIILEDLNAQWLVKYYRELLSVLTTNSSKVSRIVFPIQSGSDRILKLMNRGYEIAEVKRCLLDLHKRIPQMKLGTHIIVGFPGETDEDFQKSIELVRTLPFSYVSVFWHENRPNTIASKLPDRVEKETITKRARQLAKEANRAGARALLFNPTN